MSGIQTPKGIKLPEGIEDATDRGKLATVLVHTPTEEIPLTALDHLGKFAPKDEVVIKTSCDLGVIGAEINEVRCHPYIVDISFDASNKPGRGIITVCAEMEVVLGSDPEGEYGGIEDFADSVHKISKAGFVGVPYKATKANAGIRFTKEIPINGLEHELDVLLLPKELLSIPDDVIALLKQRLNVEKVEISERHEISTIVASINQHTPVPVILSYADNGRMLVKLTVADDVMTTQGVVARLEFMYKVLAYLEKQGFACKSIPGVKEEAYFADKNVNPVEVEQFLEGLMAKIEEVI